MKKQFFKSEGSKGPEEKAGTVLRSPWIKYQKKGLALWWGTHGKITQEKTSTVVRSLRIKYQKRGLALW